MAKLMVSLIITTMTMFLLLILSVDEGKSVECFQCGNENENCNNPSLGRKGVTSCNGKFCVKIAMSLMGRSVSQRMCSTIDLRKTGCFHNSTGGASTDVCVCSTDYCNGSRIQGASASIFLGVVMVAVAVALGSFSCPR